AVWQNKIEPLCDMSSARRTMSFIKKSVVKHRVTFIAESTSRLCFCCFWNVVGKAVTECIICHVGSTGRATPLVRKTIVEQHVASTTESPIRLCGFCFRTIIWQPEFVPLSLMGSACGTDPGRILTGKHYVA